MSLIRMTCPKSPWAVTATLASQLASNLYPVHSYFQLKSGLLLSLATQVLNDSIIATVAFSHFTVYSFDKHKQSHI